MEKMSMLRRECRRPSSHFKDSGKVCKRAETGFPARRSAPISGTGLS